MGLIARPLQWKTFADFICVLYKHHYLAHTTSQCEAMHVGMSIACEQKDQRPLWWDACCYLVFYAGLRTLSSIRVSVRPLSKQSPRCCRRYNIPNIITFLQILNNISHELYIWVCFAFLSMPTGTTLAELWNRVNHYPRMSMSLYLKCAGTKPNQDTVERGHYT